MSDYFEEETVTIKKKDFILMNDLLVEFEKCVKNQKIKIDEMESLLALKNKVPDMTETLNRFKIALKESSNV